MYKTMREYASPFAFAFFAFALLFAPVLSGTVVINEFVASNGNVGSDEDGDFEDWIEIHNPSETATNLDGYGLTDDLERPFRWRFPEVILGPNQFLRVWASGKDRRVPGSPLHTNFSISASGEPLQLTRPDGTVADFIPPTVLPRDVSMGREPDGTGPWVFFDEPTPGAANTTQSYSGILSPPEFSHASGFYAESFTLHLDHADPAVEIIYTIDGSEPRLESVGGMTYPYKDSYQQFSSDPPTPLLENTIYSYTYSQPLTVRDRSDDPNHLANLHATFEREPGSFASWGNHRPSHPIYKGTPVRARAFKPGALPSPVVTRNYFFNTEDTPRFTLPVISLTMNEDDLFDYNRGIYVAGTLFDQWRNANSTRNAGQGIPGNYRRRGREWEMPAHMEWFDASGQSVLAQDIGYRIHGGYARDLPRKFLRLYARGDYGKSEFEYPLFDEMPEMTEFRRLIMRWGDRMDVYLADVTASAVMRATKVGVQATQPVIQFLNGEFWAVTFLRERLDRFYVALRYGVDPDNVVMLEPSGTGSTGNIQEGMPSDLNLYRELFLHIANNDPRQPENYRLIQERLDIDSYIDYYHMFIFINNGDWGGGNKHNMFWRVREPDGSEYGDGRWRMIIWDFDGAARDDGPTAARNDARDMINRAINTNTNRIMLNRLLMNTAFRARFINRLADHMNTTFHIDRITELAEFEFDRIAPEMPEYFDRWDHPGTEDTPDRWVEFSERRPIHVRNHLRTHFQVGSDALVQLDVTDPEGGYLTINTMEIHPDTAGVGTEPYPWQGIYFQQVPITVTARPHQDFRFTGWLELREETESTITFNPQASKKRTAIFESLPPRELLHYWDFNTSIALFNPTVTTGGAAIEVTEGPTTEFTYASGQGFTGENARLSSLPGDHLRVNNPLGATVTLRIPATGTSYPVLRYETRRSGQGAGIQKIHYSIDGTTFNLFQRVTVSDEDPVVVNLNLAEINGAANNPDFALRISFAQGDGGTAGNNRFDNITLEAVPMEALSIFATTTTNLGGGWKWNELGFFYDSLFPYVYFAETDSWVYVVGNTEAAFYFYGFADKTWAWTSSNLYPYNYHYSSDGHDWRSGLQ